MQDLQDVSFLDCILPGFDNIVEELSTKWDVPIPEDDSVYEEVSTEVEEEIVVKHEGIEISTIPVPTEEEFNAAMLAEAEVVEDSQGDNAQEEAVPTTFETVVV